MPKPAGTGPACTFGDGPPTAPVCTWGSTQFLLLTRTSFCPSHIQPPLCQEASARAPHPRAHILSQTPLPTRQARLTCPHLHLRRCPRTCSSSVPTWGQQRCRAGPLCTVPRGHDLPQLTQSFPSEKGKRLVPGKRDFPDRLTSPHASCSLHKPSPSCVSLSCARRRGPSGSHRGPFSFRTRTSLAHHQHPNSSCPGRFTLAGKPPPAPWRVAAEDPPHCAFLHFWSTVPSTLRPAFLSSLQAGTSAGDKVTVTSVLIPLVSQEP